jgi:phage terminase large subunit
MLLAAWATMADAAPSSRSQVIQPENYAQETYLRSTAPVRVMSSRVGRGKTWVVCASAWLKFCALPGIKIALTRLEARSMEAMTLEEFKKFVPGEFWAASWGESKQVLSGPQVRCDDGVVRQSKLHVFGWLDPGRHLSAEFGSIAIDQAEQLDRRHYTFAQTRLRQNDAWINARAEKLGLAARQMSLACNPEDSEHWIAQDFDPDRGMRVERDAEGRALYEVILSSFHDNEKHLPPDYHLRLESLKGTPYYDRLVLGKWARAEGLVFPMYDPSKHLRSERASWEKWNMYPPPNWARYRGIDFGYRNPFVCLWLAENPETGHRHVYREWSKTEMLVEDHAKRIVEIEAQELKALRNAPALSGEPEQAFAMRPYLNELNIRGSFADHDAEDAATLARHGVRTSPARKDIGACIRAIASALNRDALTIEPALLVAEDQLQVAQKQPTSLPRELAKLQWQKLSTNGRNPSDDPKEKPVDAANHRIDALGYILYSLETTSRPSAWVAA